MASQPIPIENIYYLLAYAWDYFSMGEKSDVSSTEFPDLENLMAKVLANSIEKLARTGFERNYNPELEVTPRLRGKILVVESYRHMTQRSGRMLCEYDELSYDTMANRIIVSVAQRLLKVKNLTKENRLALRKAADLLPDVPIIHVTPSCFRQVQLHRNTRYYRLILSVCSFIVQSFLPETKNGDCHFRNVIDEEKIMPRLFEKFVRNFATKHLPSAKVSISKIVWQSSDISLDTAALIPQMITDITIEDDRRKLIVDCKYYREALVTRKMGMQESEKFRSGNLYQLFSYLVNQSCIPGWEKVGGMLLYPTNGYELRHEFTLLGKHRVQMFTLDLNLPWKEIELNLITLLNAQ